MAVVKIEPTKEHPVPYDTSDEKVETFLDEMAVAGNTAELQVELGASLEVTEADAARQKELLEAVTKAKKPGNLKLPSTAFAAAEFLRTYGAQLAMDASEARAAITNKLMEIANCGDPRFELKALELLGKHSDIGIFTERSEVTINYKNPEDLEKEIKERVKRLLNAQVIDITPLSSSLDELDTLRPESNMDDLLDDLLDDDDEQLDNDLSLGQVEDDDDILD
tara:strand:- start:127 stop:795 length:669 start_codon:yes stop_codon:yes gene_type:complete